MNWDNHLSSILSAADGSVAKMRERFSTPGKFSRGREDLYPERDVSSLEPPPPPPPAPPPLLQPSPSVSHAVQWSDLAAVQSQLQMQSQAIESLTQKLHDMDRQKHSQQRHLQTLQEEVRWLREQEREREREREEERRGPSPEQWRREVGRELSCLRGRVSTATSLGNLEESFSWKLRREEVDQLRREVDQLKTQLRRQAEDVSLQQSESRETRRQYERSCQTMEELTDRYRTHSLHLDKNVSQYSHTQQEVRQIRTTVSELKDEVRNLILREGQPTPLDTLHTAASAPVSAAPPVSRLQEAEPDSDSEDFSPTPSLAEVSSDDLSWLDDREPAPRPSVPRIRLGSSGLTGSDLRGPGSELEEEDDDGDEDEDDLSLRDL